MMAQPISITTSKIAPIPIVQQTYHTFCAATAIAEVESDWYRVWIVDASPIPEATLPTLPIEDWLKFQSLVAEWQAQRGATSSTTEAAICQAYQSIIGMGKVAVQFILKQLESEGDDPDQWFWALTAITGANPESAEDRGDYVKMAASWFEWAKNQGYAW